MYLLLQFVSFWLAVPGQPRDCVAVEGLTILASDLAPFVAALRVLNAETSFGYAPDFGIRRTLTTREMNTVLRKYSSSAKEVTHSVCVVRNSQALTESDIRSAIARAFQQRDVEVEVLDFSIRQVGAGELSFPLHSLPAAEDHRSPVVWRGWYRDAGGRQTAVWARVRLKEDVPVAIASQSLPPGASLTAHLFTIESRSRFPQAARVPPPNPSELEGRCVRRAVRQGQVIDLKALEDPVAIRRGDLVTVSVTVNAASVQFEGRAETSARAGQSVSVTCPNSKRLLLAKAVEKGKAIVQVPDAFLRPKP